MKETQPKIELVKVSKLKPNPANPRTITKEKFEKLKKSIQDFPQMLSIRPIVIDAGNMVLGGNMRLKALIDLKVDKVPVIRTESFTKAQIKEFIIKDNVGFGDWEWEELANSWNVLQLQDWGMEIPNFMDKGEAVEDDYEIPEVIKTDIVMGDLFEIGSHRLLCGSSTETESVQKLMGGGIIDLITTDPPYGVKYVGKTKKELTIENDAMTEEKTHQLWNDCMLTAWPHLKEGGVIYATVPAGPLHIGFAKVLHDIAALRQIMVWNKSSMVMGRSDYHYKHEPILYGWKPGASHYFVNDRTKTTVFDFDKPSANRDHPTMKPIPLWAEFINNSSKKGQNVYDPFCGSGTTIVASHQTKRIAFGMELDPKYCQVIIDRMQKLDTSLDIKKNGKSYKPKAI